MLSPPSQCFFGIFFLKYNLIIFELYINCFYNIIVFLNIKVDINVAIIVVCLGCQKLFKYMI